jgi:hypothetical protein
MLARACPSSSHPRKPHLLPLVERLVEARERGADRGGGGPHGGEARTQAGHAPDQGERGLGGAGAGSCRGHPRRDRSNIQRAQFGALWVPAFAGTTAE